MATVRELVRPEAVVRQHFANDRALPWYTLAFILFAAYAAVSISRHLRFQTAGYDLGIFEQAVRGYARLEAPITPLKGPDFHLLGDHFHPVLMLLAPVYRVFPTPITLLVAQALLLAVSVIPITRFAMTTAGRLGGLGIGTAYGLSWGLQQAIGFDFHEICFAVPLLAFCLVRLAEQRWHAAVAWALPLVLVKEDLPLTVAAIGGYLMLRGQRRLGAAVVAFAAVTGLVIVVVVIPAFNPDHSYPYAVGDSAQDPITRLLTPSVKLGTVAMLLLPTLFLALRSPLILLVLPTLAWRFWSANHMYWGTQFQYSAVLMPIVFVAFLDALPAVRSSRPAPLKWLGRVAAPPALAVALVCSMWLPLRHLTDPSTWQADPAASARRTVLATIPDDATVAATNLLAAQLTSRCTVYLFPTYPNYEMRPEWIVVSDRRDETEAIAELEELGYELTIHRSGIAIYHLRPAED